MVSECVYWVEIVSEETYVYRHDMILTYKLECRRMKIQAFCSEIFFHRELILTKYWNLGQ